MDRKELADKIYDAAVNSNSYLESLVDAYVAKLSPEEFAGEIDSFSDDEDDDEEND